MFNSKELKQKLLKKKKVLISGENQSGKTTLSKMIIKELHSIGYFPIYISDNNQYEGLITNKIRNAFKEQYNNITYEEINNEILIPIVDNFHFAKKKEKIVDDLKAFDLQILIVDDIFSLNIKDEHAANNYTQFKIAEYLPLLRNELIRKWICLDDNESYYDNELYSKLDSATNFVNSTLGKVISSGIMPSYPFFILSILSTYESFSKPLDQEITSQGYCYQALLYIYLRKQGVNNDDVDTYLNFLSFIGFKYYCEKHKNADGSLFEQYLSEYKDKYNLSFSEEKLLKTLKLARIFGQDSCGNFHFYYSYLYYYFVAKYLSDYLEPNKNLLSDIFSNLHVDDNAYISIFISHHSKNSYIIDEIVLNSLCLFDSYSPATLTKNELSFFDSEIDHIIKASLPSYSDTPEAKRHKRLRIQQLNEKEANIRDCAEIDDNDLDIELRRSIKTVEVMGRIVINRSGSLNKQRLNEIISEAINVHLRIINSFCELIKNRNQQDEIIYFLTSRINAFLSEKKKTPTDDELFLIAKKIFWNMNYAVIYGFIQKTITSLGSDKLVNIITDCCDYEKTPAKILIKHGILMKDCKNLRVDEIVKELKTNEFSKTAENIMKHLVANHCSTHKIDYKDNQSIESKLGIPRRVILQRK